MGAVCLLGRLDTKGAGTVQEKSAGKITAISSEASYSQFGAQSIFQMHKDIVFEFPKGIEPLGSSPRCKVQGMYSQGKLVTVQGHPEFTKDIVAELLGARHLQGVFDDNEFNDGMARVGKEHDGVAVAAAFLRFLLEE